jgi:hypothetical protein
VVELYLKNTKSKPAMHTVPGRPGMPPPLLAPPLVDKVLQFFMGPRQGGLGVHDAQDMTGRSAAEMGRRPAPVLATFRTLLMQDKCTARA